MTEISETSTQLQIADRCDRCGAQAFLAAWKAEAGAQLLFCRHHGLEHKDKLEELGFIVLDQTEQLTGEVAGVSSVV